MFLAGIQSTIYRGVLSLGQRVYHIKGSIQLLDIEEHMWQHVKNVCKRTALLVINLLKLYRSYTLDPGPTLWFHLYMVFITTFLWPNLILFFSSCLHYARTEPGRKCISLKCYKIRLEQQDNIMVEVQGLILGSIHVYEDGGAGYNTKAKDSLRVVANAASNSL